MMRTICFKTHWSRNREIAADVIRGETMESVGKRHDLSRTRIQQITRKEAARVWGCTTKDHRLTVTLIRDYYERYPSNWVRFYAQQYPF